MSFRGLVFGFLALLIVAAFIGAMFSLCDQAYKESEAKSLDRADLPVPPDENGLTPGEYLYCDLANRVEKLSTNTPESRAARSTFLILQKALAGDPVVLNVSSDNRMARGYQFGGLNYRGAGLLRATLYLLNQAERLEKQGTGALPSTDHPGR